METPTAALAPASEAASRPDLSDQTLPAGFGRRRVRFRQASIELVLSPGGRLRRFVVLDSERLRLALGQPRRREIEPLNAKQEHFELSTSELWAWGEHGAQASLRLLYARLGEQALEQKPATASQPRRPKEIGRLEAPVPADDAVRGELLFAGSTDAAMFCIELLEDRRRVRTIAHVDLARALLLADAQVGDTILVERMGARDVSIREERTGSHGEGHRTLRRGRELFKITKESPLEADSLGTSLQSASRPILGSTPP